MNFFQLLLLLGLSLFTDQNQTKKPISMQNEIIQKFYVIGISTRTTNENGQASKDIENLWGKFWGEEIQQQIPNAVSDDIYAVYTDYEGDYTKPYTLIIGLPVSTLEDIPEGFVGITVEEAVYKKFISKGKMPDAVVKTWMEIWQSSSLNRAYIADFTIHGEKYFDGDNAEVETFISIKE